MGSDHFWVNQRTKQISSLPKFILYGTIASFSFIIAALCLGLTSVVSPVVGIILVMFFGTTLLIPAIASIIMLDTCKYCEVSKEEQRALRTRRIEEEGLSFTEKISMAFKRRNYETPERDGSLNEGSETRNYGYLRNFINDRFGIGQKPSAESNLLEKYKKDGDILPLIERTYNREDNSSGSVYGATNTDTETIRVL